MIKIEKVNKYFNRHKKNQIHVINNTSLEIGDKGLVALLGTSGSGKTTLLNAMGGLDKVNNGKIYVNNERITGRTANRVDKIRNLNIGYIFQDYHLIDTMTVFDNIALVLKLIGVKDKQEIKDRVNYVLETIGMYRYRNRMAGMLSGGERQRVGIARAIVKNPQIIIADEPTGNLDSKNTIEIMNIIKAISKNKLVILVTHEKELAYFYASRIIELKDGVITSDKNNSHKDDLDYRMDNKIYLKDIANHEEITSKDYKINYYNDTKEKLDIQIIVKNGNLYLKADNIDKVEVIDNDSSVELIDDHYKKITKEEYEKYQFKLEQFVNKKTKYKYTSIFNPITLVINGFKKVCQYSFLKKILLLGFFISGMFILYSISNIFGVTDVKDKEFVTQNKNYLTIISKKVAVKDYLSYEKESSVNYLLPGNSRITLNVRYDDYYQTSRATDSLNGSLSSLEMIDQTDLMCGSMPSNDYEIVVDKMSIENMFDNQMAKQVGIKEVCDMLDRIATIDNMGDFKITGIANLESPSIYTFPTLHINMIANATFNEYGEVTYAVNKVEDSQNNIIDYTLKKDNLKLKKGRWPKKDYEVVVNIDNKDMMPLNKKIDTKINGIKLKVVGYYFDKYGNNDYLVNSNTIKYNLIATSENIIVYAKNKNEAMDTFRSKNLNIENTYDKNRNDYIKSQKDSVDVALVIAGVILAISFVEIYLIVRSSFLSRIKEVGIYRAIGVKKVDIYKMFLGEILAITTIGSTTGYIFMAYIISKLLTIPYLKEQYILDAKVLIISIVLIYLFNIIVGLIPVFNTIRKTPASILSRTDID